MFTWHCLARSSDHTKSKRSFRLKDAMNRIEKVCVVQYDLARYFFANNS